MELYKKYRPKTLKEIVGNSETVESIQTLHSNNRIPHAILITGDSGCGKTTLGRIIARDLLQCKGFDYLELDTGVFRGIDTVRNIREKMGFHPNKSECKVYLLDEAHMLGTGGASKKNAAQNALLKALEDTPKHVYFILCTTDPDRLLKTIRSRCNTFQMNNLTDKQLGILLKRVAKKEQKALKPIVSKRIIKVAEGRSRSALQSLNKILYVDNIKKQLKLIKESPEELEAQINELGQALLKNKPWNRVKKILQGLKHQDPETIRRALMGYMNAVLLNTDNQQASDVLAWFLDRPTYDAGFSAITCFCHRFCSNLEPPY